jgi:hypothetical protein
MHKIVFSYFVRNHLLAKGSQLSLSYFSLLQLSKKSYVASLREGWRYPIVRAPEVETNLGKAQLHFTITIPAASSWLHRSGVEDKDR